MKNIMNFCFDLRRAEQLKPEPSMEYARPNILNMDTTSPQGLKHSFSNGVADSNMVDLIVSNYFLSGAALFTDMHYGKTFTILRHPVELAISLFYYRRKATWERSYRPAWTQLTFHDFVSSEHYMDNWMTRQLTGTMPWITLEDKHLERAKLMMREKIFIGLLSEMDETLRQLKAHFGCRRKNRIVHSIIYIQSQRIKIVILIYQVVGVGLRGSWLPRRINGIWDYIITD